jgi:hypothetical protein
MTTYYAYIIAMGGDGSLLANFGKSRKFQTGKQAKKAAETLIIQREYARQQERLKQQETSGSATGDNTSMTIRQGQTEDDNEYDDDDDDDNRPAGPMSLMEEHLAKRRKILEDKQQSNNGKKERRPFDREKVSQNIIILSEQFLIFLFVASFV